MSYTLCPKCQERGVQRVGEHYIEYDDLAYCTRDAITRLGEIVYNLSTAYVSVEATIKYEEE